MNIVRGMSHIAMSNLQTVKRSFFILKFISLTPIILHLQPDSMAGAVLGNLPCRKTVHVSVDNPNFSVLDVCIYCPSEDAESRSLSFDFGGESWLHG